MVVMLVLLSSSSRKPSSNPARGSSSRSAATRQSAASAASSGTRAASGRRSSASTTSSRRSAGLRSGMALTHALAQLGEAAELQLLHRTLRASERLRDLADALLLHEPHLDHPPLVVRQAAHEPEEPGQLLDLLQPRVHPGLGQRRAPLTLPPGKAIGDRVRGDLEQPA